MTAKVDRRMRRVQENVRVVKRPASLELTRRVKDSLPSESMKAAVVAALTLGQPAQQIAQRFGLDLEVVRGWEKAYDISNPEKRSASLSEKILTFVEQEISSLMAISMVTSEEEWVRNQNASDLSQFVAVKQDRLMQVLGAFSKAQQQQQGLPRLQEEGNSGETSD